MSEPSAPLAIASSAGLGALAVATLAALGVHPQPLFWALAGATLGMSMAPAAGFVRTAVVFVCVVLLSALIGTAAAAQWFGDSLTAADTIAALTAWLFHPLAGALVVMVPQVLASLLQRWSGAPPAAPRGPDSAEGGKP